METKNETLAPSPRTSRSTVIPGVRYRDALAMIGWLERAFGFTRHAVYMGPGETVAHAQLVLGGGGMLMVGSVNDSSDLAPFVMQPDQAQGRETSSTYLAVADCAATYASANAAGAEMLLDLETKEYGGGGFTCRDPEGHIWSVGDYDPWAEEA